MTWETLTVILGGVATLAVFSFLVKENSFYRFFELVQKNLCRFMFLVV